MSASGDKGRQIYETGLRNQHAMENQAVELLERQVERLENYPAMAARMRRHIEESKEQARRLEELLSGLGTSHSAVKDSVMAVAGTSFADLTGHNAALPLLRQSLAEEEAMAGWIDEHLAETTRTIVSRSEARETAGR